MTDDIVARAKAALEGVTPEPWEVRPTRPAVTYGYIWPLSIRYGLGSLRPEDTEFIAQARTLVPELVDEVELLRSLQGLSVNIPEHGEWGSETLAYLFMDFGIQPGDGYEAAVARQGDLLRELAAAKTEVEQLRATVERVRDIVHEHIPRGAGQRILDALDE